MESKGAPFAAPGIPGVRGNRLWGGAALPGGESVHMDVFLYAKGDRLPDGTRAKGAAAFIELVLSGPDGRTVTRDRHALPGRLAEIEPTASAVLDHLNRHTGAHWTKLVVETRMEMLERMDREHGGEAASC